MDILDEETVDTFDMPENTAEEIIDKIYSYAADIRGDWSGPRENCREIWRLRDLLKTKIAPQPNKEVV